MTDKKKDIRYILPTRVSIIILASLVLCMVGIYFYLSYKLDNASEKYTMSERFKTQTLALKANYEKFSDSPKERDFFFYESNKYTIEVYRDLKILFNYLESKNNSVPEISSRQNLNQLLLDFDASFEKIISLESTLGNKDFGIIESLNTAGDILLYKSKEATNNSIKQKIEELSKISGKFVSNREDSTQQYYLKLSSQLIEQLKPKQKEPATENKLNLLSAITDHRLKFTKCVDVIKTLGSSDESGLKSKQSKILAEILFLSKENLEIQHSNYQKTLGRNKLIFRMAALLFIAGLALIAYFYYKTFINYLLSLKKYIILLREGEISKFDIDETDKMQAGLNALHQVFENLENKNNHLKHIASGSLKSYNISYAPYDEIGQSILQVESMNIQARKEQEKEKKLKQKEDKRISGLNKFASILRENATNPVAMANHVITELIDFLQIQMGAFYIADFSGNDIIYKMITSYAYHEKKVINKDVVIGKGLIGTAARDKITLYYDNLPEDYLSIVTGFGQSSPKTMLIQPLISGENVPGVIELASLTKFSEDDLLFVKTLASDIASALQYMVIEQEQKLI